MIFVLLCDLFTGWWNLLLQCKGQCECAFCFPSAYLLSFPGKHTGHTRTWASNIVLLHSTHFFSLVLPFSSSSSLLSSVLLLLFTTSISYFFYLTLYHCLSLLLQALPFLSLLQAFLPVSLPPHPPSTLSQVQRFLPCFSSNWQMRCMSWLHCCFIRKQLLALSLPPLAFSLSLHLTTSLPLYSAFFPSYLIMLFFIYLPVCTALIDVNWWMHTLSYKAPQGA